MERRFKPYFCRMERTTKPSVFCLFQVFFFFFFFFCLSKIFGKLDPPPPYKNSSIPAWQLCRINMLALLQVWMIALIRVPATSIFSISTSNHVVFLCTFVRPVGLLAYYLFMYLFIHALIHSFIWFCFCFSNFSEFQVKLPPPPPSRREIPGAAHVW